MKVSIIVPAYNEEKLLGSTLARMREAMQAFDEKGWECELIVCDNNSTDKTAEVAASSGARVIFEPVNQISRARNRGASVASGDWLVFIDADSWPSPALFAALTRKIQSGRVIGGGCFVRLDCAGQRARLLESIWNSISRMAGWAAGSFVYCEASAFHAVGGFSTHLFASEEIDLSKRLKAHGRKTKREFFIIREAWLLTSSRKFQLYTGWEYARFLARATLAPRATCADRDACHVWYDGRR
jgi:glycosyltransferase involved in cell wall biosynthesis